MTRKAIRYLIEDLAALRPPPFEISGITEWCAEVLDLQRRANRMTPRSSVVQKADLVEQSASAEEVERAIRWHRCEVCYTDKRLTVHHCIPLSGGGSKRRENSVTLCEHCHKHAHILWGPGDKYRGPESPGATLRGLRDYLRDIGLRGSQQQDQREELRERIRQGLADLTNETK